MKTFMSKGKDANRPAVKLALMSYASRHLSNVLTVTAEDDFSEDDQFIL